MTELRHQLREALRTTGLTQVKAARELGISAIHMNQILTGRVQPSLGLTERIAHHCGRELAVIPIGLVDDIQSLLTAQERLLDQHAQSNVTRKGELWRDLHKAADKVREVLDQHMPAHQGTR